MNELWKHYAKCYKSVIKDQDHIVYDSIYTKYLEQENRLDIYKISVCQGLGVWRSEGRGNN